MWEMYLLLLQQEPLFVCLFVTWHLTSWPWSRVSKQRADVDVIDLWGGLWPRPNQERHNCLTPQRDTHTHTLALSALLWTTKCRISWTEMLNIHVSTYIHVVYKYALCPYSAPPPPPLLFCKCCSCCKTMHQLHFQRLSTDLRSFKEMCLSNVGPLQVFYWQEKIIPRVLLLLFFKDI